MRLGVDVTADIDTIAAIATPPGVGGIGIVRLSGPCVPDIARAMLARLPVARYATHGSFRDADGQPIDQGLALYFPAPASYTGEHVLELHGHGGSAILDLLLATTLRLGARMARPGEFTERAFLNGKLDLTQAEAVADLIAATSAVQARQAQRTLQGALARRVDAIRERLICLRAQTEAGLDFADEELDLPNLARFGADLEAIGANLHELLTDAEQGERLREGWSVTIAGPPNAGKSSLINALVGEDLAIVAPLPGTTRDPLRADIHLSGMPVRLVDTAGLRLGGDMIEQEGMRRARRQIDQADQVLWVYDATRDTGNDAELAATALPPGLPVILVRNKIDLLGEAPDDYRRADGRREVALSAQTGAGLDALRMRILAEAGCRTPGEGGFSARRRHLDALRRTQYALNIAAETLASGEADELFAEELRHAQRALDEITGAFVPDDLLGRIFADFCVGK